MNRRVAVVTAAAALAVAVPASASAVVLGHWTRSTTTANGEAVAASMTAPGGFAVAANGCAGSSGNAKFKPSWTTNATPGSPTYTLSWTGPSSGNVTVTSGASVTVSGSGTFTFTLTAKLGSNWIKAATNNPQQTQAC